MLIFSPFYCRTFFLVGVITLFSWQSSFAQQLNLVRTDEGLSLTEEGETVFFYQAATKSKDGAYPRANYIHPLQGIHGEVLTEDFPEDHLHQRGIFWAWHQVIVENERIADGWECQGLTWEVKKVKQKLGKQGLHMSSKVFWMGSLPSKDGESKLIREKTTIVYEKPTKDLIELTVSIELKALHDGTKLGGSEDVKGYGGFSARVYLPDDLEFHAISGKITPQNTAIEAGNWVEMKGSFANDPSKKSSITLMNHPSNPQPFPGWILRMKRSMQNPVWPGEQALSLSKGVPIKLRYKMLIHTADWSAEDIEAKFKEFAGEE